MAEWSERWTCNSVPPAMQAYFWAGDCLQASSPIWASEASLARTRKRGDDSQEKLKIMLMQNFGVTNKEHYGMLWYFLEWSNCRIP